MASRQSRTIWRGSAVLLAAGVLSAIVLVPRTHAWAALGSRATGERLERMRRSPHWGDGRFVNAQEIHDDVWAAVTATFHMSPYARPSGPVDVVHPAAELFASPPPSGLRVTWFGH